VLDEEEGQEDEMVSSSISQISHGVGGEMWVFFRTLHSRRIDSKARTSI
jgi:hypothetical protein